VGPRARLDAVEKRKCLVPARNQTMIPQPSSKQPVTILTMLYRNPKEPNLNPNVIINVTNHCFKPNLYLNYVKAVPMLN
jgi:hypothetical protein